MVGTGSLRSFKTHFLSFLLLFSFRFVLFPFLSSWHLSRLFARAVHGVVEPAQACGGGGGWRRQKKKKRGKRKELGGGGEGREAGRNALDASLWISDFIDLCLLAPPPYRKPDRRPNSRKIAPSLIEVQGQADSRRWLLSRPKRSVHVHGPALKKREMGSAAAKMSAVASKRGAGLPP